MSPRALLGAALAVLAWSEAAAHAQGPARAGLEAAAVDPGDYDPHSQAWNGMASFIGLAEGQGFAVDPVTTLEWNELSANDILFLVYPLQRVDPGRLGAFVQAGGNVVLADDFGEGKDAMAALGLLRAEVTTPHASRFYQDHLWAPIATARGTHPIAAEVGEVVTNHPAALTRVEGATIVVGFDDDAVVVAGERGTGRFVAVSDPSIFINRMQADPFRGNLQLTINILRWLDRGHRARRIVLLHGDVAMYGDPRSFIDDPRGGKVGRSIGELNFWLSTRRDWLLTPAAMKGLAAALAALLLVLAMIALPVRRGPRIDGAWLRFGRPARRDEPYGLVLAADRGAGLGRGSSPGRGAQEARRAPASLLVLACILRDQVQSVLAEVLTEAARAAEPATASVAGAASSRPVTSPTEPLYTLPEAELVARVSAAKGTSAAVALARVYRRLRALPSRGQAAAPWSSGHLARRDFDALYRDVAALCRTLGAALTEAPASEEAV